MYTVRDANVALSCMRQRLQLSNSPLLLSEYFMVCRMYSDTATARETHQRYIAQVENKRSIFTAQTLRGSEHYASSDAEAAAPMSTSTPAPSFPAGNGEGAMQPPPQRSSRSVSLAAGGDESPPSSGVAPQRSRPTAFRTNLSSLTPSMLEDDDTGGLQQVPPQQRQTYSLGGSRNNPSAGMSPQSAANRSTHSAASYTIFRRDWGPEKYDEEFRKPWNAFLHELSGVMVDVVTAWVSDLEDQTLASRHLVRLSSTCCYDSAHGICLLRWNTVREVRAYVDALHAVVNAPLSQFCVPLTLGMEVLGVPVLCMSLAPVSGPWHGWDAVGMAWHCFCGLCATLRLMRPLDRVEGGRGEASTRFVSSGQPVSAGGALAATCGDTEVGGIGNVLGEGSVCRSLLRQLDPSPASNEYYAGAAPTLGLDAGTLPQHSGSAGGACGGRRNSVFHGAPTSLAGSAASGFDQVGPPALATGTAGQDDLFGRKGGLQLTLAIGADARWYFIDARAICLYQWYSRRSWQAARVPRRELYLSENGCAQRAMGPNKLILQSKLRIMVHQMLNGLVSGANGLHAMPASMQRTSFDANSPTITSEAVGGSGGDLPPQYGHRIPPILLSTLCHRHGVRYGTYVYAILDLLRTEEQTLFRAVRTAHRHGSLSPHTEARLAQCRRCIQAVVGELMARATKHLIYQEWHAVVRRTPDWLHRFQALCAAVSQVAADAPGAAAAGRVEGTDSCRMRDPKAMPPHDDGAEVSLFGGNVAGTPSDDVRLTDKRHEGASEKQMGTAAGDALGNPGIDTTAARHRLRDFVEADLEKLGSPLLDALRRIVNGVFTVTPAGTGNTSNRNCRTHTTGPGIGGATPGVVRMALGWIPHIGAAQFVVCASRG